MLKKTAAMAVLVLMIASLFSGSLGRVQADAPAKNDVVQFTHDLHWNTFSAPHTGRVVSFGVFGAAGETVMDNLAAGAGFVGVAGKASSPGTPGTTSGEAGDVRATDFEFAGIPADAGVVVRGQVTAAEGQEQAYSTMIVYVNGTIKLPTLPALPVPGPGMFRGENYTDRVISHKIFRTAYEAGALSFDGKVAMFRNGSAEPDLFDMRWENMQAVRPGEKMPPTIFTGHLVIPGANGSEGMTLPEWPFPGEYVLDTNIAVDMANLTFTDSQATPDSQYTDTISGGETKWHNVDISSAMKSVNVDLKWREGGSPLKLTIYTPDGHILGPYDDGSDGVEDGRINLNVARPSGVADGEWYLKVTDTGVADNDEYYVKTY
jgi:hypothetical protein